MNWGPLVKEATTLPAEPPPLPRMYFSFHSNFNTWHKLKLQITLFRFQAFFGFGLFGSFFVFVTGVSEQQIGQTKLRWIGGRRGRMIFCLASLLSDRNEYFSPAWLFLKCR